MGRRIRIWILVVSLIAGIAVVGSLALKENTSSTQENVLGSVDINYKHIPYITSVPMKSLYVGELFRYFVEVSDLDTDMEDVTIYLTESPRWMYIERNAIRGIPLESGTYKFVVTVSDGENSSSQVNYVLVETYE